VMQRLVRLFLDFWIVLAFGFAAALALPQAHAGLIGTEDLERDRVKAMLERPELAKALEKMGLTADAAKLRVDAMADDEVLQLAGKLDSALAGAQRVTNEQLLLIIIIILLIVIIL
jgi:hypothetical protein